MSQPPDSTHGYPQQPSYPGYPYPGPATGPFRKSRFLQYLRLFGWIPALTTSMALVVIGMIALRQPAVYVSQASLVAGGKLRLPEAGGAYSEELQFFYGTQTELLQSDRLRQAAMERVQTLHPEYRPVEVELRIRQAPRTAIFELQATGGEPRYTQAFLDALVEEYFNYRKQMRSSSSEDTLASLTKELAAEEEKLEQAQDALHLEQRDTSLAMLREQNASAGNYLAKLTVQRADLRMELQMLDTFTGPGGAEIGTNTVPTEVQLPLDNRSPEYLNARQRVEMLKLDRAELGRYLRPRHPKIQLLDEDIRRAEELVSVFLRQSRDQLIGTRESSMLRLASLEDSIREWEQKVRETSQQLADIEQRQRDVDRVQGVYERLLTLLQSLDLNKNLDQETMSVMQVPTEAAAEPRGLGRKLVQAAMVGMFLGLGVIYLLERTDDRLRTMKDVTDRFQEEVVGFIPRVRPDRRSGGVHPITHQDSRHAFAEAWRTVRSSLLYMGPAGNRPKTLLVTSAVPTEGKSTVALNLARTVAFGGSRVLLIDGDLRRGSLHEKFDLDSSPGLADALRPVADTKSNPGSDPMRPPPEKADATEASTSTLPAGPALDDQSNGAPEVAAIVVERLAGAIRATDIPTLHFLPRGHAEDDIGELLIGSYADALVALVRERFDYVIIDSAPILAADDTSNLASRVDGVLFVLRSAFTRGRMASKALDIVRQRQGRVLGLVLNRASSRSSDGYYYYRYKDYYGTRTDKSAGGGREADNGRAAGRKGSRTGAGSSSKRRSHHSSKRDPNEVKVVFRITPSAGAGEKREA
jgi:polysaccharide biosynthesis transport protein